MKFDKYSTIKELLEIRQEILSRPFPQGYSGKEKIMMDKLEAHCTNHFIEILDAFESLIVSLPSETRTHNLLKLIDCAKDITI